MYNIFVKQSIVSRISAVFNISFSSAHPATKVRWYIAYNIEFSPEDITVLLLGFHPNDYRLIKL